MKKKKYDISIFIFRRDLRVNDNRALIKACEISKEVIPIFIFDPNQIPEIINKKRKKYESHNAIKFMCDSLKNLNEEIKNKLNIYKGEPWKVIKKIIKKIKKNELYKKIAILFNGDYSVYSKKRDKKIIEICKKKKIDYYVYKYENVLCKDKDLLKRDGEMYVVFSAFYKNALKNAKIEYAERENK